MLEQFVKDCIPWKGPHTGAEKACEKEGVAEKQSYGLTTTPTPHLLAPPEGGEVEEW